MLPEVEEGVEEVVLPGVVVRVAVEGAAEVVLAQVDGLVGGDGASGPLAHGGVDPHGEASALLGDGVRVAGHGEGGVEGVVGVAVVGAGHPDGARRVVVRTGGEVQGGAGEVPGRGPTGETVARKGWSTKKAC